MPQELSQHHGLLLPELVDLPSIRKEKEAMPALEADVEAIIDEFCLQASCYTWTAAESHRDTVRSIWQHMAGVDLSIVIVSAGPSWATSILRHVQGDMETNVFLVHSSSEQQHSCANLHVTFDAASDP
jgi:hypothetical protein